MPLRWQTLPHGYDCLYTAQARWLLRTFDHLHGNDGLTCVAQVDVTMDTSARITTAWQRLTLPNARKRKNGTLSHAEDFQGDWGP